MLHEFDPVFAVVEKLVKKLRIISSGEVKHVRGSA
jgi:hypothetical protein